MAAERLFVDTWGWLVLANDRDPSFRAVRRLRETAARSGASVTTGYVLDETATRLFHTRPFPQARDFVEGVFESSRRGLLDIESVTGARFAAAWRLRLRYEDKPRVSFTGLTSFVVMSERGVRQVITGDAHFDQVGLGYTLLP